MCDLPRVYRLEGTAVLPEPDLRAWRFWFCTADRYVAWTEITPDLVVSTVFLGRDHQWGDGPPLFFETMVFRTGLEWDEGARYSTWEEAEQGHAAIVRRIRRRLLFEETP
jgi:hypothetical protein